MKGVNAGGKEEEQEEAPPSSSFSLRKEQSQVEVELRLLEPLEIYPLVKLRSKLFPFPNFKISAEKLQWTIFPPSDVLQLLDRFYNLEMLKRDDEETEILNQEE